MTSLYEQVRAISSESGYHIHGMIWLAYGHNLEEVDRSIDEYIRGQDASLLAKGESEQAIAAMIANIYNELDIDEEEPHFSICNLERWNLVIEGIKT